MAPMLRGRIVRLNGIAADKAKIAPEAQWVLNGDRGLTYTETVPKGSKLVAGKWWDARCRWRAAGVFCGKACR